MEAAGIEAAEDSTRLVQLRWISVTRLADPSPRFVARQHSVCSELVGCRQHERIRKSQASGLAAKLCCRPCDLGRDRLETNTEVREERLDFCDRVVTDPVGRDQDLRVGQRWESAARRAGAR